MVQSGGSDFNMTKLNKKQSAVVEGLTVKYGNLKVMQSFGFHLK